MKLIQKIVKLENYRKDDNQIKIEERKNNACFLSKNKESDDLFFFFLPGQSKVGSDCPQSRLTNLT